MSWWDKIKRAAGNMWRRAAGAVGSLRRSVRTAWKDARSWLQPYASRGADNAYAAAVRAMQSSSSAVNRIFREQQQSFDRARASQNIRDVKARRAFTARRVRAVNDAAKLGVRALKSSKDLMRVIRDQNAMVVKKNNDRYKRLLAERAQLISRGREALTLGDELHKDALDVLTGRRTLLEKVSPKTQQFLDDLISGYRDLPESKRDIMLATIPVGKVAKVTPAFAKAAKEAMSKEMAGGAGRQLYKVWMQSPRAVLEEAKKLRPADQERLYGFIIESGRGRSVMNYLISKLPPGAKLPEGVTQASAKTANVANRVAAHRIGEVLQKRGIAKFWEQYAKDPKSTIAMLERMKPDKMLTFWQNIERTPKGAVKSAEIAKAGVDRVITTLPGKQRSAWVKSLAGAPKPFLKGIAIATGALGTVFMAGWLRKEAPEPLAIAAWGAIKAKDWQQAEQLALKYRRFLDEMDKGLADKIIEAVPGVGNFYRINMEAQKATADSYLKLARDKMKEEAAATGDVTFKTKSRKGWVKLSGRNYKYKPFIPYKLGGGRWYNYTAGAPGYKPRSGRFYVDSWGSKEEDITLDEGDEALGKVLTRSYPESEILLGGVETGFSTPHDFELASGTYDFTFDAKGYKSETRTVTIWPGEEKTLQVIMEPEWTKRELTTGTLSVDTEPMGAYILLNDMVQDYPTPTRLDLEPGEYTIQIKKPGYMPVQDSITIEAAQNYKKSYTLVEEEEPGVWRVYVSSDPSGGKILVNGDFTGSWTPGYVDLRPGSYTISVEKSGYAPMSEVVNVG